MRLAYCFVQPMKRSLQCSDHLLIISVYCSPLRGVAFIEVGVCHLLAAGQQCFLSLKDGYHCLFGFFKCHSGFDVEWPFVAEQIGCRQRLGGCVVLLIKFCTRRRLIRERYAAELQ